VSLFLKHYQTSGNDISRTNSWTFIPSSSCENC